MKKNTKRLLSLMLSLILVVGMIPGTMTAHAATGGEEPTYSITVSGGTADKTEAKAGEVITITATTPSNMGFRKWLTSDVELADATAATTTFVMPAKKVTIQAENLPLFNVFVIGGSADKTRAFGTETVTITANAPADGMKFVGWTSGKSVKFADAKGDNDHIYYAWI